MSRASPPLVLGVSAMYHDAAAAIVRGGDIVAAAQEERFTRRRHDPSFPRQAIDWCLAQAGGADALDAIAYYEDPVLLLDRVVRTAVDTAPAGEAAWARAARRQLGGRLAIGEQLAGLAGWRSSARVHVVDHHLSHAASAFFPSPFPSAAVLVVDGVGEWASTSIGHGQGTRLELLSQVGFPHSLGLLYATVTRHCGFKVNSGEYKLMGLAPFGEPRMARRMLDELVDLRDDGSFRLDLRRLDFLASDDASGPNFSAWAGFERREPEDRIDRRHADLAASVQAVLNEALLRLARTALARTGERRLCLAGGVALNGVAVGRLRRALPALEDLWIQPASGDAGGALGAALQVAHAVRGAARHAGASEDAARARDAQRGSLLGPDFDDAAIEAALLAAGVPHVRPGDAEAHRAAVVRALAAGEIVARFDGPMEFGPRALGNRSILADARRVDGQRHLNARIKFREGWRPFAPIVRVERAAEVFELDGDSPYMLHVVPVRGARVARADDGPGEALDLQARLDATRSPWPAITHVDGSARVQTVDAGRHPGLHALLLDFEALTGSPVLVNTSFNVRGEPIVRTPEEAIRCFLHTGVDVLAIGGFLVRRDSLPPALRALEGRGERFEPD